jgi:hypothetical protein
VTDVEPRILRATAIIAAASAHKSRAFKIIGARTSLNMSNRLAATNFGSGTRCSLCRSHSWAQMTLPARWRNGTSSMSSRIGTRGAHMRTKRTSTTDSQAQAVHTKSGCQTVLRRVRESLNSRVARHHVNFV